MDDEDEIVKPPPLTRHTICMVCDFFFPRLGGVEMHIWSLSQCLLALGHRVVVVTGNYAAGAGSRRTGVRYMTNGLKVYYLPLVPCFDQAVFPSYFAGLPLFRNILLRERVGIVHGHAATSVLVHDCLLQAKVLGLKTVFTDHSLFNFHDPAHINLNKYASFTMRDVDAAIGVSNTSRENLIRRCGMRPTDVSAIPNAVDTTRFAPDASGVADADASAPITVILLSRLVFRKGIDLAAEVIPRACAAEPRLRFIVGGDGPKRLLIEEMRERHGLADRVTLLGAVAHSDVPAVLRRGAIFLNTSLTESFCIAILEAASTGAFVVSTGVGGVPEVLPPHMCALAEPNVESVTRALLSAIPRALARNPAENHAWIAERYSWQDVAVRTVLVYDRIAAQPRPQLADRLMHLVGLGPVFGPVTAILTAFVYIMAVLLELVCPAGEVEVVPDTSWAALQKEVDSAEELERAYDACVPR
jgi:phosphatidylinositol glycan class A protein